MRLLIRLVKRALIGVGVVLIAVLALRAWESEQGPPLPSWLRYVPGELDAGEIDRTDWSGYLSAEERVFAGVKSEISDHMDAKERAPFNRYDPSGVVYPPHFDADWNRSFVLEPDQAPVGVVVLLHGLTDSPYSLRHIGALYQSHGFVALGVRLPAHGTVPAALTRIHWEDWLAAVRLAMREAARRAGGGLPIHVVGYSNGGALAVKYALDALEDSGLRRPDRIVLLSPMIGVTGFARFAGLAAWPALLPAFAKTAWLDIAPEYNPFKYNSFPVNAAKQSYLLTKALQSEITRESEEGRLKDLAPILTFQSVLDDTVSASAVTTALYAHLPKNGSELVLFDINRAAYFGPLLRPSADAALAGILPGAPRNYRTAIITNANQDRLEVVERATEAGADQETVRELKLSYPPKVFSLSHVALPFPVNDGLYGLDPEPGENFGIKLGALAVRGERGALIVGLDSLMRISSNPFFPYETERIESGLGTKPRDAQAGTP